MTPRITVFDVAAHFGLKIEVANDLPPNCGGCLLFSRDPSLIVINGNRPEIDQRFTVAHEIGHYVLHPEGRSRTMSRWSMRQRWNWHWMTVWARLVRRWAHRKLTCEQEADVYAMLLLDRIGDLAALRHFLKSNPKQLGWFLLCRLTSAFRLAA